MTSVSLHFWLGGKHYVGAVGKMFRREVMQAIMQAERADQDGRRHEDGSPQGRDPSIDGAWFTTAVPEGHAPAIQHPKLSRRALFVCARNYAHGAKIIRFAQRLLLAR